MRILIGYFIDGKHSGIDKYILSFINAIKSEDVYIDVLTSNSNQEIMDQYVKYNVSTIIIPRLRNPYKQYKKMNAIFKENFYDIAYFNISEAFNAVGIYSAYKNKIKKIIVHSHASDVDVRNSAKRFILQKLNQFFKSKIAKWGNTFLACSKKAAQWLYPKRIIQNNEYEIIYNAIDDRKFKYNEEIREKKRKELKLEDKVILGHVGNFCYQKNQEFLVELINKLDKNKYHMLLIGVGNDFEMIKDKIDKMNLNKNITLLGLRKDVNELMQAFDIFLLPSNFEGLPIVGVEAETAGLPCIFSDKITDEILLTENSISLPLDVEKWKEKIEEFTAKKRLTGEELGEKIENYYLENQKRQFLYLIKK